MATINLITRNNGTVTAYQDAIINHFIKGIDKTGQSLVGVYDGVGSEFKVTLEAALGHQKNNVIVINSGLGIMYGRLFSVEPGNSVKFDLSTIVGTRYGVIYVEIDTRDSVNQQAKILMSVATNAYPEIDAGNNLIANENGVARAVLYNFYYNSSSSNPISGISKKFLTLEANKVENAKEAEKAKEAENALMAEDTKKIAGNVVSSDWRTNRNKIGVDSLFTNIIIKSFNRIILEGSGAEVTLTTNGLPYNGVNFNDILFVMVGIKVTGSTGIDEYERNRERFDFITPGAFEYQRVYCHFEKLLFVDFYFDTTGLIKIRIPWGTPNRTTDIRLIYFIIPPKA